MPNVFIQFHIHVIVFIFICTFLYNAFIIFLHDISRLAYIYRKIYLYLLNMFQTMLNAKGIPLVG